MPDKQFNLVPGAQKIQADAGYRGSSDTIMQEMLKVEYPINVAGALWGGLFRTFGEGDGRDRSITGRITIIPCRAMGVIIARILQNVVLKHNVF